MTKYFCNVCGMEVLPEELNSVYGYSDHAAGGVCDDCYEYYNRCSVCRRDYPKHMLNMVADHKYVCPDCLDENYTYCSGCYSYINRDEYMGVMQLAPNSYIYFCETCIRLKKLGMCSELVDEYGETYSDDSSSGLCYCKKCQFEKFVPKSHRD